MNKTKITQNLLFALVLALILSLISCNRTKPQSPSNRHAASQKDSAAIAMVLLNQRLAQQADKDVIDFVRKQGAEQFVLENGGYWVTKTKRTDAEQISENTTLDIRLIVYDLEEHMLIDSRENINLKQHELIAPVLETLHSMHYGESARLVIPWYAAYGATGSALIPPYTNLIIDIETYN